MWQHMDIRCIWSPVDDCYLQQYIINTSLRIFNHAIKVSVFTEDAGISQFKFRLQAVALIFYQQIFIGKRALRVFVQVLAIRMGRGG